MNIDERLDNLEIKLAYMEDFVNQIQEVAVQQTKDIERLKAENRLMAEKIKELISAAEGDIPNRKPPHY
ncbi:MAG: SlyX family protein [Treponema sp.]|nr:SlyX family protein [Treponema sp.]